MTQPVKYKGFIFDYRKCVGCHACIVACFNENGVKPPLKWRSVNNFNKQKLPLLGFVHQSIACNHCVEAPCRKACPSGAYFIHEQTGAILHQKEKCLGCKYCIWICPYDAPRFNTETKIIEKCNFCSTKQEDNSIPNCALNCPTGALSFGDIEAQQSPSAFGFPTNPIYPRIKVIGEEVLNEVTDLDDFASTIGRDNLTEIELEKPDSIFKILKEWSLSLFTSLAALLVGLFLSQFQINSTILNHFSFLVLVGLSATISLFHLGKPFRAYLSIANFKSSWLSKEILFFGLFSLSGFLALFLGNNLLMYLASVFALLLIFSIELLYSKVNGSSLSFINSSNCFLITATYFFLFSKMWTFLFALIALRFSLLIILDFQRIINGFNTMYFYGSRVIFGSILPLVLIAICNQEYWWIILIFIFLGDFSDRILFYYKLESKSNILKTDYRYSNYHVIKPFGTF